jgi:hypothetical protein
LALRKFFLANFINPRFFVTDSDFEILGRQLYSEKYLDRDPRGFGYLNGSRGSSYNEALGALQERITAFLDSKLT